MNAIIEHRPALIAHVEATVTELHHLHMKSATSPKISTIKSVRKIYGLGLREAKELVEVVCEGRALSDTCLV